MAEACIRTELQFYLLSLFLPSIISADPKSTPHKLPYTNLHVGVCFSEVLELRTFKKKIKLGLGLFCQGSLPGVIET